jgi:hypothetical protein
MYAQAGWSALACTHDAERALTIDGSSIALLERSVETQRLGELVDVTRSDGGGAMWVEGEAGIGKTSLVNVAHELARGPA